MAITKVSRGLLNTGVSDSSDATAINITSGEDVGIGTDNPDVKLDIRGEVAIEYNATYGLRFYNQARNNWGSIGNNSTNTGADLIFKSGSSGMNLLHAGDFQFNSGYGSITTVYGVRAWVKFQGDAGIGGGASANRIIDGSGNVSSIGYIGAGRYQMNFTNSMPDTNYAVAAAAKGVTNHNPCAAGIDIGSGSVNVAYVEVAYGPTGGANSTSLSNNGTGDYCAMVVR